MPGRHTVVLNSAAMRAMSAQMVINAFNDAYPGSDYETLKNQFDTWNNRGCPLGCRR